MWPPLPATGFIKGRAATKQDVNSGDAAFFLESNGKPEGRPLNIDIPQYALLRDETTGADVPVIIVQAETNGVSDIVGCIAVGNHTLHIATLKEVSLLGTDITNLPAPNNALERERGQ